MKNLANTLQQIAQGKIWIESVLKEALNHATSLEEKIVLKTYIHRPCTANFHTRMVLQDMVLRLQKSN